MSANVYQQKSPKNIMRFFSWSQGLVFGDCINHWQTYPWNTMRSVTVCAKGILKDKHDLIVLFSFEAHSINGWFYYGACALSPSVISVVCFGDLPSSRFTVSSKKRRSQTGIICCVTALFGGPVKGWEKGINKGFKIYVLFLSPTVVFFDNTWIYNLGEKLKLEGSHHGDLILLAGSFLQLQYI